MNTPDKHEPETPDGRFAYSHNEEEYTGDCESHESAASDGFDENPDCNTIWTGQCVVPKLEDHIDAWDAQSFIENLCESNPEQFGGEWAMGYPEAGKGMWQDLAEMMSKTVGEWLDKHSLRADFFCVVDVKKHTRTEEPK